MPTSMKKNSTHSIRVVIEHLEEELRPWIFLEYRHVSLIFGKENTIYTNIPNKYHRILNKYGYVYSMSIIDIIKKGIIKPYEAIILDPWAEKELTIHDLDNIKYVIIGGILGDHPPRKRTPKLLSSKLPEVEKRNIGKGQYSIDGAAYYVYYLYKNRTMNNYEYVDGVIINTVNGYIKLPFRYPVVNGKPLLAPGLIEFLTKGRLPRKILEEIGLTY